LIPCLLFVGWWRHGEKIIEKMDVMKVNGWHEWGLDDNELRWNDINDTGLKDYGSKNKRHMLSLCLGSRLSMRLNSNGWIV